MPGMCVCCAVVHMRIVLNLRYCLCSFLIFTRDVWYGVEGWCPICTWQMKLFSVSTPAVLLLQTSCFYYTQFSFCFSTKYDAGSMEHTEWISLWLYLRWWLLTVPMHRGCVTKLTISINFISSFVFSCFCLLTRVTFVYIVVSTFFFADNLAWCCKSLTKSQVPYEHWLYHCLHIEIVLHDILN
jgi:hypothetical protein